MPKAFLSLFLALVCLFSASAQDAQQKKRVFSGVVLTQQFERVPNVTIEVQTSDGKMNTTSDATGNFRLEVPRENLSVSFGGKNIEAQTQIFAAMDTTENLQIKIKYKIPPIHESLVIQADALSPESEYRNSKVYENTLFSRDDQLLQTLNAGINAGQHEGGGKSLEIRRFGFNLDHGGVNGGLKILVDNVQQNQGTQGHGQGYLGSLKSLSPELVQDVSILNGPFSAQYGDFSGLGVVHIRQRETLPQQLTVRLQGGRFDTFRTFIGYSPVIKNVDSYIAYEGSRTDGPFINPLKYIRDNFTGNFTYKFNDREALGFKFNGGRNLFTSSGQIPLDEVAAGRLDRFGFIDPDNGGKVFAGTGSVYYRKEFANGGNFKADGFVARSLFDLWSNFTFFLNDPVNGDEVQQHDSRLQEGANVQYLQPFKLFGNQSLLTVGGNFHANQINVGLDKSISRNPFENVLKAQANINNYAVYIQNGVDLFNGHLRIETGLRIDAFTFDVDDKLSPEFTGKESAVKLQPKFAVAWSPFETVPASFYFNYGRGISSQDARSVVRNPDAPKISTTDFYQAGASYNHQRFSVAGDFFFIDRSNEQVFIPDDGSIEFAGRSRSYGFELKTSAKLNRFISFNGGLTQVIRAYYPGQFTESDPNKRVIIDSAPHTVANAGLNFNELYGFNFALNWRHISSYRLDAEDRGIRAAGHDVVDFNLTKRLNRWIDLNFGVDNLFNKRYYETQNYFESQICSTCEVASRIHATPGYPVTVTAGVTFRLFAKD